jgi:hypothetical protein
VLARMFLLDEASVRSLEVALVGSLMLTVDGGAELGVRDDARLRAVKVLLGGTRKVVGGI